MRPVGITYCSGRIVGRGGFPNQGSPLCNGHEDEKSVSIGLSILSPVPGTPTPGKQLPGTLLETSVYAINGVN